MNAVKLFKEITKNPEKVESIDLEKFMNDGELSIKLKNLTDQEKEDLNHLRINNINGILFDDREKK